MGDLKYIMIDYAFPVIFGSALAHKDVAFGLRDLGPVTSAGFVQNNGDGTFSCYGESISLGIKSDPDKDTAMVNYIMGQR